jgi:hypothetical protein
LNHSEKLAAEYLRHCGFHDIRFEPDGNIPPDFLIDNAIAVEVRELNQNQITDSRYRGLDEAAIPLLMKFKNLLISLGPAQSEESWFVRYKFLRPIPPWKQLQAEVRKCLLEFRENPPVQRRINIMINDNFVLNLIRATDAHKSFFIFGGYGDHDSGGWVLAETLKNLRICIEEKTRKVARVRHKYPEWWLLLIDRIGFGVEECDQKSYREHFAIEHNWDKIVLVNPLNPSSGFEL